MGFGGGGGGGGPSLNYQSFRTATQAAAGGSALTTINVNLPHAYADTNYTLSVMVVEEGVAPNMGVSLANGQSAVVGPQGPEVVDKTAAGFTCFVLNTSAAAANVHLEVITIHD